MKLRSRNIWRCSCALLLIVATHAQARAQQTWDFGAGTLDWNDPLNWSNGVFPDGVNAIVNTDDPNQSPVIAATPASGTPVDIFVGDGSGNAGRLDHIAGDASTGAGNWMFVGVSGGTGTYNLADTNLAGAGVTGYGTSTGSFTASRMYIGGADYHDNGVGVMNMNTTGTVTLTDANAGLILGNAYNGGSADATLNLENGTINNAGETWIGRAGAGVLTQTGGTLNSSSYFAVGRETGNPSGFTAGDGTVYLDGGTINAAINSGFAVLGSYGGAQGYMNVSGGAFNTGDPNGYAASLLIGEGGFGNFSVEGTGGNVNITGNLHLALDIAGAATAGTGYLSFIADSAGVSTVNVGGNVNLSSLNKDNLTLNLTNYTGAHQDIQLIDGKTSAGEFFNKPQGSLVAMDDNSNPYYIDYTVAGDVWLRTAPVLKNHWLNPSGGNFNDAGNWSPGVPESNDDAVFNAYGVYTVTLTQNEASKTVLFDGGGDVTLLGDYDYDISSSADTQITGDTTVRLDGVTLNAAASHLLVNNGTLNITGGGKVSNTDGSLGDSSGSSGVVTVADPNSVWENSGHLVVGFYSDATLEISNGGRVTSASGTVAANSDSTAQVTVDGSNSLWENSGDLIVANYDSVGLLEITAGGKVSNLDGYLGKDALSAGTVTVAGVDSLWENSNDLHVGVDGAGTLNIDPGGLVTVGGTTSIGSSSNINLQGGTLATESLDNTAGGTLNFASGTLQFTGASGLAIAPSGDLGEFVQVGSEKSILVDHKLIVADTSEGTLYIASGGRVSNSEGYIGYEPNSAGVVHVDHTNSRWENSGILIVGQSGSGLLAIAAGGRVSNTNAGVGYFSPDSTGHVIVGTDGLWENSGNLVLGYRGAGTLEIAGGGKVISTDGYLGSEPGSSGVATVADPNSHWENSGSLVVGQSGVGTLNIDDDGLVTVGATTSFNALSTLNLNGGTLTTGSFDNSAGGTVNHTGGSLVVDGGVFNPGSSSYTLEGNNDPELVLANGATIAGVTSFTHIGDFQNGAMRVLSGSTVNIPSVLFLGVNSNSDGTLQVAGQNSQLTVDQLNVGEFGGGALVIEDGGVVHVGPEFVTIASQAGSTGHVTIQDPMSSLQGATTFDIGREGTATFELSNGATVNSLTTRIGALASGSGHVQVTGAGSTWTNTGDFFVGGTGSGNGGTGTLDILDDGLVSVAGTTKLWGGGTLNLNGGALETGSLDNAAGGTFNHTDGTLIVDGGAFDPGVNHYSIESPSGTSTIVLINSAHATLPVSLSVGDMGDGELQITGGSQVSNQTGYIGFYSSGSVTVSGPNSKWENSDSLSLGYAGQATLNITDGGVVACRASSIGEYSGDDNIATVAGPGSRWDITESLEVGLVGRATLRITSGGSVNNADGYVGRYGALGTATVGDPDSGMTSTWTNSGDLSVGTDPSGAYEVSTATLDIISSGRVSVTGTTNLWSGGAVNLSGGMLDTGALDLTDPNGSFNMTSGRLIADAVTGDLAIGGGTLQIGSDSLTPAEMTVQGDLQLAAGATISLNIGASGVNDSISVTGALTVADGAILEVQFDGSVDPNSWVEGASWDLLDFDPNNLSGGWDPNDLTLPALANGLTWNTANLLTTGVLSVTFAGDFDLDVDVDGADFLAWQRNPSLGALADWQANFGLPVRYRQPDVAAVPEPSAWLLTLVGLALTSKRRRR